MAGTLTVQNLQGPSSGANANKVLIPSGQTLHAPGHVIGLNHNASTTFTTNSTGETLVVSVSYVPKVTGSKLFITGMSPRYQNNSSTGSWHSSAYLHLKENGVPKAAFEHVGTLNHSGESAECVPFSYFSDAVTAGTTYTYGLYHAPTASGTSTWYFGRTFNHTGGSTNTHTRITVMEIAQ